MKLLANENFPLRSVQYLKETGFDIIGVGIEFRGVSDEEVMELAISQERTILTFDSDYGELIFKYGYRPKAGVIYLRMATYSPVELGKWIEEIINPQQFEFENALIVIDSSGVRQPKYQLQ